MAEQHLAADGDRQCSAQQWIDQWLAEGVRPHQPRLRLALLFALVLQFTAFGMPLFFQLVIDKVLVHGALTTLNALLVGFGFLLAIEALLIAARGLIDRGVTRELELALREGLLRMLLDHPSAAAIQDQGNRLLGQFRRVELLIAHRVGAQRRLPVDLFFLPLLVTVLALFSAAMTGLVLLMLAFLALALWAMHHRSARPVRNGAADMDATSALADCLDGAAEARRLGVTARLIQLWRGTAQLEAEVLAQDRFRAELSQQITQWGGKLLLAIMLFAGSHAVLAGSLTVGQLIAFNLLLSQLLPTVARLASYPAGLRQVHAARQVLAALIAPALHAVPHASPSAAALPQPALTGRIELRQIAVPGVAQPIDLRLTPGGLTQILSPTALAGNLARAMEQALLHPHSVDGSTRSSTLLLDDRPAAAFPASQRARSVRLLGPDSRFFSGSLLANLALASGDNPAGLDADLLARITRACQLTGAADYIERLPLRYDSPIGPGSAPLSRAFSQRLALARALLSNPRTLVLDHALSALTPAEQQQVLANLRRVARAHSLLFVAAEPLPSALRDRLLVLDREQLRPVQLPQAAPVSGGGPARNNGAANRVASARQTVVAPAAQAPRLPRKTDPAA